MPNGGTGTDHVLLDAAEETREKLSENIVVAPWFLAEFKATIEVIGRWKNYPKWKDIEPSLTDKDCFSHTVGKLRVAEHFMKSQHKVEIVPRGENASPDLKVPLLVLTRENALSHPSKGKLNLAEKSSICY